MKSDTRPNGKYATIAPTESGMFKGTTVEVWEGYQWYISHCVDTSIAGIHHWLYHRHGIAYDNITLI